MPEAQSNGITLQYETFGDSQSPPILLIMGLASQLVRWPEEFCQALADRGLFVIRFDNRDAGLSTQWRQAGKEEVGRLMARAFAGETIQPPYTLADMALDAVGLLDSLGISKAHICGLSMGGMIAQRIAMDHPGRVLTLTSMQSSPANPMDPPGPPEAVERLMAIPPNTRDGYIRHSVESFRVFAGGSPLFDEHWEARKAAEQYDRGYHPLGVARQFLAVSSAPSRVQGLGAVTAPALVIHGANDTLIIPEHGRATARAIPGARFRLVDGLGHGMGCPALWEGLAETIFRHTQSA